MKQTKIYAEVLEESALEQFNSAMEQDFAVSGALMPDAHTGYSLPIGAVVATEGVIVPAWVGYDIGCGMCALPTTFNSNLVREKSDSIFDEIYKRIPVGFAVNGKPIETDLKKEDLSEFGQLAFEKRKGLLALGTLGGGNHFIEIGEDESETVWIIIHSGSRGVGHGIATEYMRLASGDGKVREGPFGFETSSDLGCSYINDQAWGLEFALQNRQEMIKRVIMAIQEFVDGVGDFAELINRNHNHADLKDGLWIHRKGATHAEEGMMGVIPGNMRDGSFIVRGLGNPESLWSSSHGAGRVLGRKQAKRELDLSDFESVMGGIKARVETETLDESPMAYKDIFEVMRLQNELVEITNHVRPIINIKG